MRQKETKEQKERRQESGLCYMYEANPAVYEKPTKSEWRRYQAQQRAFFEKPPETKKQKQARQDDCYFTRGEIMDAMEKEKKQCNIL